MTAFTIALVKSDQYKQTYLLTGDNSATAGLLDNATLLANAVGGPLKNALNQTYANQAAMRAVFGIGAVKLTIRPRSTTWAAGVDVDVDAVTPTKPEFDIVASTVPGASATAYLDIEFQHSTGR
jgi:hypothetical protein